MFLLRSVTSRMGVLNNDTGNTVGEDEGTAVGDFEGSTESDVQGSAEGVVGDNAEGDFDGNAEGDFDGNAEGDVVEGKTLAINASMIQEAALEALEAGNKPPSTRKINRKRKQYEAVFAREPVHTFWGKPRDAASLRELEQLRVLAMYEFDPPLSSAELLRALHACGNCTKEAYEYLKANHRHQHAASAPGSTRPAEKESEKRRLSPLSVDNNVTPKKRHKDQSFALMDWEEMSKEDDKQDNRDATPETQKDNEMSDYNRAQQVLLETVEDRVAARQPLRNPEWINDLCKCLQVSPVLELAMHLNLTVDALATWAKEMEIQDAQDIQTLGVALTVEVAASLPRDRTDRGETMACLLKETVVSASDEEVAAVVQAENDAANLSAMARANAAKHAIECLSSACKAYMDQLRQFSLSTETGGNEKTQVEATLEVLSQKLMRWVDESTGDVTKAECALSEAKETKETQSLQIVQCVRKRHEELVTEGETNASASIQSVIEVWKQSDVEVQALWKSRSESEQLVEKSARALKVAQHALTFHKSLSILFRKVRERREKALMNIFDNLVEARSSLEARATIALGNIIPALTHALCSYYEFHAVQQSKAKKEVEEQEKALAAHNEYFGDSASIKKGDIERRIREFVGVTQSSMQLIMEVAEDQQQLWEDKHSVLSESIRRVLIREIKTLWLQLSGPMQEVVKNFVTTIEESAGGAVVVEPAQTQKSQQESVNSAFVTTIAVDEQVLPAFTVPVFPISHGEAVTPYRTAISAIAASTEVLGAFGSLIADKEHGNTSIPTTISSINSTLTESNEAMLSSSRPQEASIEPRQSCHEFAVGSVLYLKVAFGENSTQFVRGVVVEQLDNDMYLMQYDNGDSSLWTEQNRKDSDVKEPHQDMEMEDTEHKSSDGTCAIM